MIEKDKVIFVHKLSVENDYAFEIRISEQLKIEYFSYTLEN